MKQISPICTQSVISDVLGWLPRNTMGPFNTENFIVRIYRHEGNNPQRIVGVVEQVGVEGKRAFHNFDELWAILASAKAHPSQTKAHKGE